MTDVMTIGDCRNAGYCVGGARLRCDELGLDFKKFMREGLPISDMEKIEDVAIIRSLVVARARIAKESSDGRR